MTEVRPLLGEAKTSFGKTRGGVAQGAVDDLGGGGLGSEADAVAGGDGSEPVVDVVGAGNGRPLVLGPQVQGGGAGAAVDDEGAGRDFIQADAAPTGPGGVGGECDDVVFVAYQGVRPGLQIKRGADTASWAAACPGWRVWPPPLRSRLRSTFPSVSWRCGCIPPPQPPWPCALTAGVLSSAVPFLTDLLALRRVPAHFFGVFVSVNPVCAALIGLVVPGQHLDAAAWLAMLVIVGANTVAVTTNSRSTS